MSVHRDRTHHRPRVYKAPGPRTRWSFPWKVVCDYCGYRDHEMTQHGAFVEAMSHAMTPR